ncbi:MAG: ATP-binding protein [Spirochaetia bacterium]|nr:ATP-binding protein [Spirochaetia bacterium]
MMQKPKTLLADPDKSLKEIMIDLLSTKMNIDYAPTIYKAEELCEEKEYNLLISEIDFPGENALDFIKKVKQRLPNIMVVIITGKATVEKAVSALRLGTTDFMQKPFSIEDLALMIDRFFAITANMKGDYDLLENLSEEKRTFILNTNFNLINSFINEIIEIIKRFIGSEKKITMGIRLALYEMLINAMEHGNLGITSKEKKELINSTPNYLEFLNKKAFSVPYNKKKVWFTYHYKNKKISFTIKDEGSGFDTSKISQNKEEFLEGLSGRGIFLSKIQMDSIEYNKIGNSVTMTKDLSLIKN